MSESRIEWKVGVFVLLGVVLMAALMLSFSKGLAFFKPTYEIRVRTKNVGGIKPKASVLLAGVPIGHVEKAELTPDSQAVIIHLRVDSRHKVHGDAKFVIDSMGFLGDQYVAIHPTKNEAPVLADGAEVQCQEPFDIQEVARAALGFIQRVDTTARELNDAIKRVSSIVLNTNTLTNVTATIANFRNVSQRATNTMNSLDGLLQTNSVAVTDTMANFKSFSSELDHLASDLSQTLATNRADITAAIQNLRLVSEDARRLLADLEAGRGLAGSLLKNEQFDNNVQTLVTNVNHTVSNLTAVTAHLGAFSSNMNSKGLWGVLWKPKPPTTNRVQASSFEFPGKRIP